MRIRHRRGYFEILQQEPKKIIFAKITRCDHCTTCEQLVSRSAPSALRITATAWLANTKRDGAITAEAAAAVGGESGSPAGGSDRRGDRRQARRGRLGFFSSSHLSPSLRRAELGVRAAFS